MSKGPWSDETNKRHGRQRQPYTTMHEPRERKSTERFGSYLGSINPLDFDPRKDTLHVANILMTRPGGYPVCRKQENVR